ncbi:MAG: amidohydrolase family protein [Actinobacteria bacterium]|nr:amidohydrolase family protein [Actinomycetota bacterium]
MSWECPGFVDHHTHLLRLAAGGSAPWGSVTTPEIIGAYHRRLKDAWTTPMDDPEAPVEVTDGFRGALEGMLNYAAGTGLVQVTEAGMNDWAYLEGLLALRSRGPLPLRVRLLVASGIADVARMAPIGDPWLEVIGVKFYADGWLGTHTCALSHAFVDEPEKLGVLFLDAETLASRADPFAEAGLVIATHAIGDRAIETVLDAYEKIYGKDCAAAAPRIEHAQVLRPDLVARMASMGVVACIQPGFGVADAPAVRASLGEWASMAYRWDELMAAGVRVITGSDFPVDDLRPLAGLQRLSTGANLDGGHPVAPSLPMDIALGLMTDAAAGVTVLADDIRNVAEDELAGIEIVETIPSSV